jgi:hypothetical protein
MVLNLVVNLYFRYLLWFSFGLLYYFLMHFVLFVCLENVSWETVKDVIFFFFLMMLFFRPI